jgi:hypothetical protein
LITPPASSDVIDDLVSITEPYRLGAVVGPPAGAVVAGVAGVTCCGTGWSVTASGVIGWKSSLWSTQPTNIRPAVRAIAESVLLMVDIRCFT